MLPLVFTRISSHPVTRSLRVPGSWHESLVGSKDLGPVLFFKSTHTLSAFWLENLTHFCVGQLLIDKDLITSSYFFLAVSYFSCSFLRLLSSFGKCWFSGVVCFLYFFPFVYLLPVCALWLLSGLHEMPYGSNSLFLAASNLTSIIHIHRNSTHLCFWCYNLPL